MRFALRSSLFRFNSTRKLSYVPVEDHLFGLNEEESALRDSFRKFFETEIPPPIRQEIDKGEEFPNYRNFMKKCGDMGILGLLAAEEYGGTQMGISASSLAIEEAARVSGSAQMTIFAHMGLCAHVIEKNGNDDQKSKFLPDLISGEKIGALAMSEPSAGSDVMSMKLNAVRPAGKDYYVINGNKFWITNGPWCDTLVVYAKTSPEKGSRGVTAFVIDTNEAEGFTAKHIKNKLGVRGSATGDLHFDNVKVPAANILGGEGKGAYVLMSGLNTERLIGVGAAIGYMQAAVDCAFPYVHERKQFGKPVGSFQLMQGKMADMYAKLSATRAYGYSLMKAADRDPKNMTNHDCAAVLMYAANTSNEIALEAVQMLGGNGYINEYPASQILRDSLLGGIGAGTTEVRKLIIGRHFNAMFKDN